MLALLKRQNAARLKQIERQDLEAIEKTILALIKADPGLAGRFDIVTSIPSIQDITAFALIIDMPELGTLEAKQAASLAGLAPVARQSEHRPRLHSRRQGECPAGALHARNRRHAIQPGPQGQICKSHRQRKTRQSRTNRNHPKAARPCERLARKIVANGPHPRPT